MARQLALRSLLLAGSLLAGPALADSVVKEASTRVQDDPLKAAAMRLHAAVDRAEDADLANHAQRSQRTDLLGRARDMRTEADVTRREGNSRASLITSIDAVTTGLLALADASVATASGLGATKEKAPFGEAADAGVSLPHPHSATSAIRFHDVSQDAIAVLRRLSGAEAADVRQLVQAGEDVVALVKAGRRSDHVARTAHLRSLEDITSKLQALHQTGLLDRKKGQPFVPATRVTSSWLPLSSSEAAGLQALRVRFDKPGSAWVMLQNATEQPREFFVEIEFYDHVGESTGTASVENAMRSELKPGEVRKVLVPIIPSNPRFWDETTGFTLYVE